MSVMVGEQLGLVVPGAHGARSAKVEYLLKLPVRVLRRSARAGFLSSRTRRPRESEVATWIPCEPLRSWPRTVQERRRAPPPVYSRTRDGSGLPFGLS